MKDNPQADNPASNAGQNESRSISEESASRSAGTSDEGGEESRLAAMFRSFRHRNYRYFFSGQIISLTGTWMQSIAQAWLVYRLTDSTVLLGLVSFAGQIPVFLLATLGGAVADRYERKRILAVTQTASMTLAFILAGLTLTEIVEVWHIFVLAALFGIVNAFDIPTRQAFVVGIVERADLANAIALNSSMFNGARIVGPAVAGLLVASVGEGWCFFLNAASYVGALAGLRMIKVREQDKTPASGSTVSNIVEGFRYVSRTAPVRSLILLLGVVSLMGMPYAVLMPIFAARILGGDASSLGILMGASGVGALAAALTLAARKGLRGLGFWIASASAGFGASLILFSFSRSFRLSALLLVPAGFSMMIQMAASNTLVQLMVPDELRGRVMAVYSMMFMGMAPFGAMLAGTVAQSIGAPYTVALGGAVCIVGAAVFGLNLKAFRFEAKQIIVALNASGGQPIEKATGAIPILAIRNEAKTAEVRS